MHSPYSRRQILLGLAGLSSFAHAQVGSRPKHKIVYRRIKNNKAYIPIANRQFLAIKVTPPKLMGPDAVVFVEIYNMTKTDIAVVTFDLTLHNQSGLDLSSKIDGKAIRPNSSGVSRLATPGKGPFPPVSKVSIENLRVLNTEAIELGLEVLVDLIDQSVA